MSNNKLTYIKKSISYLCYRHVLRKPYLVGYSPEYELSLKFKTQDGGGRAIYKRGIYEHEISELLLRNLKLREGDVVLDVGANIGWYSLLMSRFEPNGISIYCFEPDPDNYNCLVHNLDQNRAENVSAHQMGVSDKTGTKTLYLYKKSNTGRHSMLDINTGASIEVKTTSLDDFLKKQNIRAEAVKFLKIDIEGFEYFAFKGAPYLLNVLPYFIAEFAPGYMRKGGVDIKKLVQLLRNHDFNPFIIENGIEPIDDDTLVSKKHNINLLWVKKGYDPWK